MRRFSQRNALVTLSEINITPLLDLAFVLLIIFVITTPLLEQSLPVTLNKGGASPARFDREKMRTVEISENGVYAMDRRTMSVDEIEKALVAAYKQNPDLTVVIRADKRGANQFLYDIINRCNRNGITKFSLNTEPEK